MIFLFKIFFMGNKISDQIKIGTIGEILIQLRLLQYDVQSAPPIKDSGNDLIAIKGDCFRSIQVKTTAKDLAAIRRLPLKWHMLGIVFLSGEDKEIYLDNSVIKIIPRNVYEVNPVKVLSKYEYEEFNISEGLINALFL